MAGIGPKEVRERYGVEPEQVPDFIALRGDPSDKLPGAPGVGSKGGAGLLRRYGTLEELLAQGRFKEQAEELRLYRWIATMDKSAPLPSLHDQTPTWAKASALVKEWDLNRLARRLDALVHLNLVDVATMAGPQGFNTCKPRIRTACDRLALCSVGLTLTGVVHSRWSRA